MSVSQLLSQNKANCSLSAFDKENSIESLLDLLYYIYNYYVAMLFWFPWSPYYLSTNFFAICCDCDMTISVTAVTLFCDSVIVMWYFPTLVIKKRKRKRKEILNNDLAVLLSYDNIGIYNRYSPIFLMLYQLYHSLPFFTLTLFLSLYLSVTTWVTP